MTGTTTNRGVPIRSGRIRLTEEMIAELRNLPQGGSVPELSKKSGLPYMLIYNLVHGRVNTVSLRNYRRLFRREPPPTSISKADGAYFRAVVDLYLFLRDDVTKADLYREFYPNRSAKKIDYRIFSGGIATVAPRLIHIMEDKFTKSGIDPATLQKWIAERQTHTPEERVPFSKIRPVLDDLEAKLGVHPTFLLKQTVGRYESGRLLTVPRAVHDRVIELQSRVEALFRQGREKDLEILKEEVYGGKPGYTPYSQVAEALTFLRKTAKVGSKRYLGRGRHIYETGGAKRIPDWRAEKIWRDCERFIEANPHLPLSALPKANQRRLITVLLSLLVLRTTDLLYRDEGVALEKRILRPSRAVSAYEREEDGFTQVDRAFSALGMRPKAFDLMVAMNCEIFKSIGKYTRRWYLPDRYLAEIRQKEPFQLIKAKYELMARGKAPARAGRACMN